MNIIRFLLVALSFCCTTSAFALSSSNIPLDSPIYIYLEKLSGIGLIASDVKGIRPFSKSEAVRLLKEAETNLSKASISPFGEQIIMRLRELMPREYSLYGNEKTKVPFIDYNPIVSARLRYINLDGTPRNYERQVHDPGNDGVFGIGSGLRPPNAWPSPAQHHGREATPLLENNEGIIYGEGNNAEVRVAAEGYLGRQLSALMEPQLLYNKATDNSTVTLNRAYLKLGDGSVELEIGQDSLWMGLGYRGAITLSNNSKNLSMIKLSSPEPFNLSWLKWLGQMKYSIMFSQLDHTVTAGTERQPWFYAFKLISKPVDNFEIGFNMSKQAGGKGLDNSVGQFVRGIFGGTYSDNSNGIAGFEARYRAPFLRNTEFFAEFSGEDSASFWPIVESYLAGFYIPMLTSDGKNDLRFEYFRGNNILYTNSTMPQGYIYHGLPLGHSQGGATEDFFLRFSHWLDVRNNLALEYFYTNRGSFGILPGQSMESKHAGRINWRLPVYGDIDGDIMYGIERINNFNLVEGDDRTNQILKMELTYRY